MLRKLGDKKISTSTTDNELYDRAAKLLIKEDRAASTQLRNENRLIQELSDSNRQRDGSSTEYDTDGKMHINFLEASDGEITPDTSPDIIIPIKPTQKYKIKR